MQVSLESGTEANIYETVLVQAGKAIHTDLMFDEEQEHIYVLTDNRVSLV